MHYFLIAVPVRQFFDVKERSSCFPGRVGSGPGGWVACGSSRMMVLIMP